MSRQQEFSPQNDAHDASPRLCDSSTMCQNTVSGFEDTGAHDAFQGWVRGSGCQACMRDEAPLADSGWHYHRRYSEQPWGQQHDDHLFRRRACLGELLGKCLRQRAPMLRREGAQTQRRTPTRGPGRGTARMVSSAGSCRGVVGDLSTRFGTEVALGRVGALSSARALVDACSQHPRCEALLSCSQVLLLNPLSFASSCRGAAVVEGLPSGTKSLRFYVEPTCWSDSCRSQPRTPSKGRGQGASPHDFSTCLERRAMTIDCERTRRVYCCFERELCVLLLLVVGHGAHDSKESRARATKVSTLRSGQAPRPEGSMEGRPAPSNYKRQSLKQP